MGNWTPEQQKEHRKLWVEALRSGKYQQATRQLRDGDAFCCLGVACEISGLGKWSGNSFPVYLGDSRFLPTEVREWLGISGRLGGFGRRNRKYLADLNDDGTTFSEIADIIESEPEGLLSSPEAA